MARGTRKAVAVTGEPQQFIFAVQVDGEKMGSFVVSAEDKATAFKLASERMNGLVNLTGIYLEA